MPSRRAEVRKIVVAGDIAGRHPDILVGGFLASGLRAASVPPLPDDTEQALVNQDVTLALLADHPLVKAWREAIAACGLKPSTYKSSPEQLARRTLKSGPVRTGLPLVDLYCEVATRHLAPLGGYDVDRLPPPAEPVELRLARPGSDRFDPLGGGDMPITEKVAVYAAGSTVLCWAYNCRDSRETCLTADTDTGLFLGEAVTGRQQEALRAALEDLHGRLSGAGARVGAVAYADAGRPVVDLDID